MRQAFIEAVRKANRHWVVTVALFGVAAMSLHFAVETWWKAALIMLSALCLDIAVDLAFTKVEEEAGEID